MRSIKEFAVDDLVEAVAKALKVIDPSKEYPARAPKEMSARYRVGTTLANACKVPWFLVFSFLLFLCVDKKVS